MGVGLGRLVGGMGGLEGGGIDMFLNLKKEKNYLKPLSCLPLGSLIIEIYN